MSDGGHLAANALTVWRLMHCPFGGVCIVRLADTARRRLNTPTH